MDLAYGRFTTRRMNNCIDVMMLPPNPAKVQVATPLPTVAMLTNLFPPLTTGSSTQCYQLARELATRGHRVVVFTAAVVPGVPACEVTPEGVEVFRLSCRKLPNLSIFMNYPWFSMTMSSRNLSFMARIARERDVKVLHVHNHLFDMAFNGSWLSWRLGVPMVVTNHTYAMHPNRLYNTLFYLLDRMVLKYLVVDRAAAVIAPDINTQDYLRRRFNRADGTLIPYGISIPTVVRQQELDALRSEFNLVGKRVILSLGQLHVLRNRISLIRAMPEIVKAHPNVRLVIVGVVGHQPTVDLVNSLGLSQHVIFTGSQPHERIPVFNAIAEFNAVWLDYNNDSATASLGIGVMEAMYYGKAVISMGNIDTYGAGQLENRKHVLLLADDEPATVRKALMEFLDNPSLPAAMGQQAAAFAKEHFAWELVGARHVGLYEKLCASRVAV
jgi:1,2-diacylglycerol 3-alpha-glucosyltransferase